MIQSDAQLFSDELKYFRKEDLKGKNADFKIYSFIHSHRYGFSKQKFANFTPSFYIDIDTDTRKTHRDTFYTIFECISGTIVKLKYAEHKRLENRKVDKRENPSISSRIRSLVSLFRNKH